ncbi:uncharacterized protein K460DRAFT_356461 [Cucurbitaria berberidis CBS 394.84]|uniref:Uncharacterized protein n=1 Tax=Cucurbitaria berberidis CBS 394.84 TaxID=1168544 RepID=A0A9P4GKB7_9PLEO|nr:uncharacterized protein K460DRAFT_356461 [Cucurbitaria berberidis CBS 394.84]KAF1846837.1 hypothetical protein K460DRAFT_356461 [Cucurbitaria berberidis CBS 394.84]
MSYLIQPSPSSGGAGNNSLYIYTLSNPDDHEKTMIRDLGTWGWVVTRHNNDDIEYLDTLREIDRAVKQRRRRTQMIFGDMVGEGPRLPLEEVWEREARIQSQRDCEISGTEQPESDQRGKDEAS